MRQTKRIRAGTHFAHSGRPVARPRFRNENPGSLIPADLDLDRDDAAADRSRPTALLWPPRGPCAFHQPLTLQQLPPVAAVGVHDVDRAALEVREVMEDDGLAVGRPDR